MTIPRLALIRHGRTAWNAEKRIQGHTDIPLSPEGHAILTAAAPPAELEGAVWLTSPLRRARETATLLGAPDARPDPRLIEMSWGAWEGRTLADLRAELGAEMLAKEAAGLDFRPPGGESPADVLERLRPLLAEVAETGGLVAAVTHKGVIRALMAAAFGWDMTGKAPVRLERDAAHLFGITGGLEVTPIAMNLPFRAKERAPDTAGEAQAAAP